MKTTIIIIALAAAYSCNTAQAQKMNPDYYLKQLPKELKLDNSIIRSYQMTTDYLDYDLKSNFVGKRRLTGKITYGLKGDFAKWEDVYFVESKNEKAPFAQGIKQKYLEGFKYQPNEKIITKGFFEDLPEANTLIKNLFWDMLAFDVFAYSCWDSLKLLEEFHAEEINSEIDIAGIGTFENRDIRITWVGITEINNEICAVLNYSAMNNPLNMELENMSLSGRSHYWGEVYVSLSDKQIEHANLTEDVLTNVKIDGQPNNIVGYTVRTINLLKIK